MPYLPFENAKRKLLVKQKANTEQKYGRRPEERTTEELLQFGIINIDKPSGPSSHQVSAHVRQILGLKKTGHSGTLDPKVTGVLPVALGKATRIVQSLLTAGKEYIALMHIHASVDEKKLRDVCKSFVGNINQLPPVKSAVKRQVRKRKVYYLEILEIKDQDVLFIVGVQAGTYIRKLIHDIGMKLKVGAHMVELRRTKAGPFKESNTVRLQDLQDAMVLYRQKNDDSLIRRLVLPVESGIQHMPKIWILDTTVDTICHGSNLKVPGISRLESFDSNEKVAILTLKDELVAVGVSLMKAKSVSKEKKGLVVKLNQVFMKPGTYPKIDRPKPGL